MAKPLILNDDRLFSVDPSGRAVARRPYASVSDLPIISPNGHTVPEWFASNRVRRWSVVRRDLRDPSSDPAPQGHLLPQGEKGCIETFF
jgi:hypothetical protein